MEALRNDVQTGRLFIIDVDNPPEITAEEFLQYVHEGFVPVTKTVDAGTTTFTLSAFTVNASTHAVAIAGITFNSNLVD
jgi:hypothetical protein